MLLFLVEEHLSREILETIERVGDFARSGAGIAFQIDVEDAVGVAHQMEAAAIGRRGEDLNPPPIHADGWLVDARMRPSPNFDARPAGVEVDLVVVHGISLPPGEFGGGAITRLFCNDLDPSEHPAFRELEGLRVSAHALIERDGAVTQYVSLLDRAWHAGKSRYRGRTACNDFSIGIELEGTDTSPYERRQYETLAALARAVMRRWPAVRPERIVGHSEVAPGRKTDPGPSFDWSGFFRLLGRA